jgi:hypothetical protein
MIVALVSVDPVPEVAPFAAVPGPKPNPAHRASVYRIDL